MEIIASVKQQRVMTYAVLIRMLAIHRQNMFLYDPQWMENESFIKYSSIKNAITCGIAKTNLHALPLLEFFFILLTTHDVEHHCTCLYFCK